MFRKQRRLVISKHNTYFGYQKILLEEKEKKVGAVFNSVANKYDMMNDLMSLGIHRLWKRIAINNCAIIPGDIILDLAGGTGDLTILFSEKLNGVGEIYLSDINRNMLNFAKKRLFEKGIIEQVKFVQVNAEQLAFPRNAFDCISIGFGLRNVTHKQAALKNMYRVLKFGGKLMILEFSQPTNSYFGAVYDLYSFSVLPKLGDLICKDPESYQYLVESIRMHPDQETLKEMMESAGFENCTYKNLTGGIAAIHMGYKL